MTEFVTEAEIRQQPSVWRAFAPSLAARADELRQWIDARGHDEIWEVILTGGDPLILSPKRLSDIMARLTDIPHVAVVRFHSRVPIATPERLTPEHIAALGRIVIR